MKFLVVGCGSIGRRHIANLIALGYKDIILSDINEDSLEHVRNEFGLKTIRNFEEVLDEVDVVFILTPNVLHAEQILKSVKKGKHVFVEKPLAISIDKLDEIKKIAREKDLVISVGCNLRFHPLLKRTKEMIMNKQIGKILGIRIEFASYLPEWKPWQDYKQAYSSKKSMSGGVLFDFIHELDYTLWLFGEVSEVFCYAAKVDDLEADIEDTIELIFKLKNGVLGEIHLDVVQREYSRNFKIFGTKGTIIGDLKENKLKIYNASTKEWITEDFKFDYNKTYLDETNNLIASIKKLEKPVVSIEQGIAAVKFALAAKKSSEEKKAQKIK